MIDLTAEDLAVLNDVLGHRIFHLNRKLDGFEEKQLRHGDDRRQGRIAELALEIDQLIELRDRMTTEQEETK